MKKRNVRMLAHRRTLVHEQAFEVTIASSRPTKPADVARIMVLLRTSYERLKNGAGTNDDFDRIGCAVNVGLIRAESIDSQLVAMFQAAGEALLGSDRLHAQHGRYGFTGPHLLSLNAAMDLYEEVLTMSTPNQMQAAVEESCRRIRKGEVLTA